MNDSLVNNSLMNNSLVNDSLINDSLMNEGLMIHSLINFYVRPLLALTEKVTRRNDVQNLERWSFHSKGVAYLDRGGRLYMTWNDISTVSEEDTFEGAV